MMQRFRRVLPPWPYVIGYLIIFTVIEGPLLYAERKLGQPLLDVKIRPSIILISVAVLTWGSFRVLAFHPFYRRGYRNWLEQTPWTVQKPLPLGPIRATWGDGIVLALLSLPTLFQPEPHILQTVKLFLMAQNVWLAGSFWTTGAVVQGPLCVFGMGLAIRVSHDPWSSLVAVASTYVVACWGLRQSLAHFPWPSNAADLVTINGLDLEKLAGPACGWPYDQLYRNVVLADRLRLSRVDALVISLLAGWLAFCLAGLPTTSDDRNAMAVLISMPFILGAPLLRLGTYVGGYLPPLSVPGRLRTGRLIIPGYDRCLVAPILAVACGITTLMTLREWAPLEIAAPASISLVVLICLISPPGLREWRLTGAHRITPGGKSAATAASFVELA